MSVFCRHHELEWNWSYIMICRKWYFKESLGKYHKIPLDIFIWIFSNIYRNFDSLEVGQWVSNWQNKILKLFSPDDKLTICFCCFFQSYGTDSFTAIKDLKWVSVSKFLFLMFCVKDCAPVVGPQFKRKSQSYSSKMAMSKEEYLKRYLSGSDASEGKKKKKSKTTSKAQKLVFSQELSARQSSNMIFFYYRPPFFGFNVRFVSANVYVLW